MSSRVSFAAGIALCLGLNLIVPPTACADDTPASATPAEAARPWIVDQDLAKAVWTDIQSGGILTVATHVSDMEKSLSNANQSIEAARSNKGTSYVLTDGPTDSLLQMTVMAAAEEKAGKAVHVVAVDNPYPAIGFYLGSYYNETDKFDDAVRVLDEGLASSGMKGLGLSVGAHDAALLSEKGAALVGLKRWPDALASYDAALKIDDLDDAMRAHVLRGRGYALTELNRLDEAEQAYNDSLKYEPGNARARSELRYIAGLRAGSQPIASSGLAPLQSHPAPPAAATPAPSSQPAPSTAPTN